MCRAPAARVILGLDPRIHSNKAVCFFGPSGQGSLSLPPEGDKKGTRRTVEDSIQKKSLR